MIIEKLLQLKVIIGFAVLILPGFLIMKIIRLKIPNKEFLLKDVIFEALAYSLLNLSIFGWLPYYLFKYNYDLFGILASIFTLIVSPLLLAFVYIKLISSKIFMKNFDIQMPTAWDWYFSQRPNVILLVHMKNGVEIIGYFGEKSYATSFPNEGSIYLEKVYTKDKNGNLIAVKNSNGILIANNEYLLIEFFDNRGEKYEWKKL